MIAIQITVQKKSITGAAAILRAIPRAVPRVFRRAINRTVDSAATDMKRRVSQQVELKKSEIAKGLRKRKASLSNLSGSIGVKSYRPGLLAFAGTRQTKRGVSYRISRGAGRKRIEHAFITTVPGGERGHRGVFVRRDLDRLPIVEQLGPSIWAIVTRTPELLRACTDTASAKLSKHIDDQVGVELRKWSR